MATINSNNLAVYALDSAMTTPMGVFVGTDTDAMTDILNSDAPAGAQEDDYFLVVKADGSFIGIGKVNASGDTAAVTDATSTLTIVALATSSSLETSNSLNETAARNGNGGSTNFIASGAMTWSTSVDGLLDVAGATGSAVDIMDAARDKKYMIVKFDMDEGSGHTFYAGQALIESVSISGGVDDIATYSASFSGYGDLYKG
jgi:hypothetical protein